jgi:hypothetical protein
MTDTRVRDLLDALAETAPEPSDEDLLAAVYASAGLHQSLRRRRLRARRSSRSLAPVLVAAATVVAVLLAAGVVSLTRSSRPATPAAAPVLPGDAALAAGRAFGQQFFSIDHRTVGDYSAGVAAASTGAFRSEFTAKQSQLGELTSQAGTLASGRVLAAAARDVTPTTATVLLVADQDVSNALTGGSSTVQRYRVAESLRLVDGRWLVDGLEPITGGTYGPGCPDPTATPEVDDLLRQSCSAIATLYSYDYRRLDADIAAQLDLTTGSLRQQLVTDTGPAFRELASRTGAAVTASISTAAIERLNGDTATVLMFSDQSVSSNQLAEPRLDHNRVEATMQRVDGRWLVSDVKAL